MEMSSILQVVDITFSSHYFKMINLPIVSSRFEGEDCDCDPPRYTSSWGGTTGEDSTGLVKLSVTYIASNVVHTCPKLDVLEVISDPLIEAAMSIVFAR